MKTPPPAAASGTFPALPLFLSALFGLLAVFPDAKLVRFKLLLFEAGVFAALAGWAAQVAWTGRARARVSAAAAAVAAWALFLAFRWVFSGDPALAAAEMRRALLGFGAFWIVLQVPDEHRGLLWRGWGLGAALLSIYGLLQRTGGLGPVAVPHMERAMGTFGNPIFFAGYLVFSLPLLAHLAASSRGGARGFWSGAALLAVAALWATGTRAAWLAAGAAGLYAVFVLRGRARAALLVALAAAGLFAAGRADVWRRDQAHLLIWRDTLKLAAARPLAGVGPGAFHVHFPAAAGEDLKAKWPQGRFIVNYAHNEYLQALAETGLPGLLIWLAPFALAFRRRAESGETAALRAALVAGLVQAFFSVDLRFSVSTGFLYALLGGLAASGAVWKERSFAPTAPRRAAGLLALAWLGGFVALQRDGAWRLNLLGVWQAGPEGLRTLPEGMRAGFLTKLVYPYAAQRRRAASPDFFDERLLDPARTIAELEALAARHPGEAAVWEKLGFAYAKEIQARDAAGARRLRADMADKAVAAFARAAELDPSRPGPLNNLGNVHFTMGRRDEAVAWWTRAVQAAPDRADARLNLGKAHYLAGRLKESAEQFRRVLELDPSNDEAAVYLRKMVE